MSSSRVRGTLVGSVAVLCWAMNTSLTKFSEPIPTFLLVAGSYWIAVAVMALKWMRAPRPWGEFRQPLWVWIVGVMGIFGNMAFYVAAIRLAPPDQVNLINYLWPLLIVLLAAGVDGEKLRPHHLIGVLTGLAGTVLLSSLGFAPHYVPGYLCAFGAAATWAVYSVAMRRLKHVSNDLVIGFCAITALLATVAHILFEPPLWPDSPLKWLAVAGIGIGPVGAAYLTWDYGVKHGDIRALSAICYALPLISNLLLAALHLIPFRPVMVLCALLVTAGAAVASWDLWKPNAERDRQCRAIEAR